MGGSMILAILQARVSSTRLPGKVLKPILGQPMLYRQLERVRQARCFDALVVATSVEPSDDPIVELCRNIETFCFRGSLDDVLDRFYHASVPYQPDHVVRLTGDCPLADPHVIDDVIHFHLEGKYDYTSNTLEPTFPDGLDVEVMRWTALKEAWTEAKLPSQREHVTPFIHSQPNRFKLGSYKGKIDFSALRWTVDELDDLMFVKHIYEALYTEKSTFGFQDVLNYSNNHPNLRGLNSQYIRNEGLQGSLAKDEQFLKNQNRGS